MREVGAINVCTRQATQCIRDGVLFTGLMLNIQPELLEELRCLEKMDIYPHGVHCQRNRRLLEDIKNSQVVGLDNNTGLGRPN